MAGEDANIAALYERHALAFDELRGKNLFEKPWLDRFTRLVAPRGHILDLGCGAAEPLAASLIKSGFRVTGVDTSETLIGLCRTRFPERAWFVGDMRSFDLPAQFDGILAWHSFFHLNRNDQRAMFPRFAKFAAPGAALMFTSGHFEGEAMGEFGGEPLFHASLGADEYRALLGENGFEVVEQVMQDPGCGGATVWLARKMAA
ncbi:class I SAM-dependent methyltransferase [Neorhizobium alkalisoli]|uniref:Methyltransferase family protein n=1 Tax=Neorhizobium alkalisoli TaxID=528178 RepID=A0A561R3Z5_9HYPH|nr:class I SAM-dependent methyltransferase [Neorhizobium alkalisoli]TWF57331.1 methyltransferase family protein [Neorhizobium alkalisoli]